MDSAFPGSRKQLRDRKPDLLVTFAAGRNDSKFDRVKADGEREMPKRVIDFDALWASDKLASCAEWAQSEYAWLYGLADASGSFEMTNLRVIWGRVAAIRKNLTLERLQEIFDEFTARGLLFTWEANGKRYGHWTGSDVPGRLPAPSWRMRLEKLAPPVPCAALAAYSARFGGSKEGIVARANRAAEAPGDDDATAVPASSASAVSAAQMRGLKHEVEEPQGQDWDLGLDGEKDLDCLDWEKEKTVCPLPQHTQNRQTPSAPISDSFADRSLQMQPERCSAGLPPEELLEIYEQERGELPAAGAMTPERRRRCARRQSPQRAESARRRIRAARSSARGEVAGGKRRAGGSLRRHGPAARRLRRSRESGGTRADSGAGGAQGACRRKRALRSGVEQASGACRFVWARFRGRV